MKKATNHDALVITDLHVETADGKKILNGISLTIHKGEVHAIMGPNGSGKTTFSQALMGNPGFVVTKGSITLNGEDITYVSPDTRAKKGLFLSFQYPVEISGVAFGNFLRLALNEKLKAKNESISPIAFRKLLLEKSKQLAFAEDFVNRSLNEGFSGGEKKKAEIVQMSILKPDFAILDEPDSGLDVDALKYIAKGIKALDYPFGLLLITHYQRILDYITPDYVHILVNGKIVKSGDSTLPQQIEKDGYERIIVA